MRSPRRRAASPTAALLVLVVALSPLVGSATALGGAGPHHDAGAVAAVPSSPPVTGPAAPSGAAGPGEPTRTAAPIRMEYTVSLTPGTPGEVGVRAVARLPPSVTEFHVDLPDGAEVVSLDGFDRGGELDIRWDGSTGTPTFAYTVPANRTDETFGGLVFADAGSWALVNLEAIDTSFRWRYSGSNPGWSESFAVDGEGYAGPSYAYLGPAAVHERDGRQAFALVVPEGTTVGPGRSAVFDTLIAASDQLRVGDLDGRVNVFVARPPIRQGGTAGGDEPGANDVWVRRDAPVATPDSVWLHEYVHTRQAYEPTERMEWFDEASAEYYAALLSLRQGRASWTAFRFHVSRSDSGVLADGDTWASGRVEYTKGSLVLAALDARIRAVSGGDATLMDVFGRMNQYDQVSYARFESVVAEVAGQPLDAWLDRYVAGSSTPSFPGDPSSFAAPTGTTDSDGDGLDDGAEAEAGTNPFEADTDGDGLEDGREVDVGTDPTAADTDDDGLDDGTEVDEYGTDPTAADTDGDGLADGAEVDEYDSDPTAGDTDGDGLADGAEVDEYRTIPTDSDTDGDGLADGAEVDDHGTDPTAADTDGDGLDDGRERDTGTDPTAADTDDDGLADGAEVDVGTDPVAADTDGDGLADGAEVDEHGSDPTDADTDGDGLEDGDEVEEYGTDPAGTDTDGDGYPDDREVDVGTDPTDETGPVGYWVAVVLDALGLVIRRPAAAWGALAAGRRYRA